MFQIETMMHMTTTSRALLIIETHNLTSGYRALDLISRVKELSVLDAHIISGGRFLISTDGPSQQLEIATHEVRKLLSGAGIERIVDEEILIRHPQSVLKASYALSEARLSDALLVIETQTNSAMFAAAEIFVAEGLEPIEIKIHRSGSLGAHGFFTASAETCTASAEIARSHLRARQRSCEIEVIAEPSSTFKSFFFGH